MSKPRLGTGYAGGYTSATQRKKISVSYVIREKQELQNRSGVNRVRISSKANRLYSAGRDSIIRCWDLSKIEKEKTCVSGCLRVAALAGNHALLPSPLFVLMLYADVPTVDGTPH